jgi:signal transduction histidine kinase
MSHSKKIKSHPDNLPLTAQIRSNERFTDIGVNIVMIIMALVALLPLLFDSDFPQLPPWHIGAILLLWLLYIINGTFGMMLHERYLDFALAPVLYFGLQIATMAGLLFLTSDVNGSMAILILPIAAQSMAHSWSFTAVISTTLMGLLWIIYFPNQPWQETIISLLSIGSAMVFTLIFTNIAVRESSARSEIQRLATDLHQANHRLAEYAAQIEELATMRERNRVAREIHDNLGHYLTVVNVQIAAAKTIMDSDPDKAQDALSKAQILTQEGLTAVRQSVSALRESPLENQTLSEALNKLISESRETGLVTELIIEGSLTSSDPKIELTLLRAVQEGLTNVRKHARASRVDILLRYAPSQTVLSLKDNGVGTAVSNEVDGSFGLIGIQERVQLLGGQMRIDTGLNEGFQFTITLPHTQP